jgi:hypothetical protein
MPSEFIFDQTAVSLKPVVRTAWSTALFWTGSISLNSSGSSALYCTAGIDWVFVELTGGYAVPGVVPLGAVVTTSMPIKPIGTWMDGCVPDSSRYVPGLSSGQVSELEDDAATSVAMDWTRGPWAGGSCPD